MTSPERTMEDYLEAMGQGDLPRCPECRVKLKYFYGDDVWVCGECGYVDEYKSHSKSRTPQARS